MNISDIPDPIRKAMNKDHESRVFIIGLLKKFKELESRIEELEKLMEDSEDSVPSFVKPNKSRKTNKKLGRPKGHKGTTRPKPKEVDETIELKTASCPNCDTELIGKTVEIKERYVEDIEPAKPKRKKYRIHRKWCPKCKKFVTEKPDDVIPKCRLGLNLLLFIAFYRYVLAMPVNKMCTVLEEYYQIHISTATIINEMNLLAKAFGKDFNRIIEEMRHEHSVHGDETGRRIKGINHWLWAFATKTKALYVIRKSRGSKVPKEILAEDFDGVLVSDFWDAYNWIKNQQKCWSHVLRKTKDMKKDYILHYKLKKLYRKAKRMEESKINKKEKLLQVGMLEREIEKLRHIPFNTKEANAFTKTLVKHKSNLFRFVTDKRVEATNNHGERVIRPTVVMRKISGGHRSDNGARTFEVNMSVIQTWKLQKKNFFEEGMNRVKGIFL